MKYMIAVILLAVLSGCPMTPTEVRNEAVSQTFVVDDTYQNVYRTIKKQSIECWATVRFWSNYYAISGDLYTDLQEANIYFGPGGFSPNANSFIVLDITPVETDRNKTQVVIYINDNAANFTYIPIVIENWFNGSTECHTDQDYPVAE